MAGEAAALIPIVASSDMNHYESREIGDAKNAFALAAIERIDPEALFGEVLARDISMCGFLPATALPLRGAAGAASAGPRSSRARRQRGSNR